MTSTRRSARLPSVWRASSTATEGIETFFSLIPVSSRARPPAARAPRKRRVGVGPVPAPSEPRRGPPPTGGDLVGPRPPPRAPGLADDHRVGPGGDPEGVPHGLAG